MTRVLAAAVLVLSLAACDSDGADRDLTALRVGDLSQDPAALVGTWELATLTGSGECLGDCQRTVPASARQRSETLTFSADGTFEQVAFVQRAMMRREGPYEVRRIDYDNGTQSEDSVLFLDGRPESFGLEGDRLYFDDRPVDGELSEFVRQ